MLRKSLGLGLAILLGPVPLRAGPVLEDGFANPPVSSRPGAFWCWLNGSISHEQITRDLEEMKAKGMGGAEIWDVAQVYLNGKNLGVVWTPPFRVNIGAALKTGENLSKVEVVNLWANRMIGDKANPSGGEFTKTNMHEAFNAGTPLLPSGLLGPVRIIGE